MSCRTCTSLKTSISWARGDLGGLAGVLSRTIDSAKAEALVEKIQLAKVKLAEVRAEYQRHLDSDHGGVAA